MGFLILADSKRSKNTTEFPYLGGIAVPDSRTQIVGSVDNDGWTAHIETPGGIQATGRLLTDTIRGGARTARHSAICLRMIRPFRVAVGDTGGAIGFPSRVDRVLNQTYLRRMPSPNP